MTPAIRMTAVMITITRMRMITTIPIPAIATRIIMTASKTKGTKGEAFAELPLLLWLSPTFPVGAFAYSHGLEWAVEAGDIADAASLGDWLNDLLKFGAPRNDAILFAAAHRAATKGDWSEFRRVSQLAVALAGTAERRLETLAQGSAFLAALRAAWRRPALDQWSETAAEPIAYPIAVALGAAAHNLDLAPCLEAFLLAVLANLVSAAVRLGPIGQSDGQRLLAAALPRVRTIAAEAAAATLDDLGGCAFRSDIAAMRHETQYSRLFRS
ncbi:MAG TPA: urease accessory protein UreF [Roseiarcus sp.]|nr:urease accessory protein UreF [Roseiarcus sp.]